MSVPLTLGEGPRRRPGRPQAIELAMCAALYASAATWLVWLAAGASAQGVITGEEASITHAAALSVPLRWQPSIWSTNFGSQVFYWAAGHLTPQYGLLYARPVKAVTMAALAPLCYLVARRRLACGRAAAVLSAALAVALPGVAMVSWVGTENGLEALWGVAALLVVTSRRAWWPVGLALAGVAVSNYTAGLAWAGVVLVVAVVRVRSVRDLAGGLVGAALGVGIVLAPLAWWRNGGVIVTGGGYSGAQVTAVPVRLHEAMHYLAVDGSSYYYFSDLPALGGQLAAVVLVAVAVAAVSGRFGRCWPWGAVVLATVSLYAVASGVPGVRRLIAVTVVLALLAAPGTEVLAEVSRRRTGRAGAATAVVLGLAVTATVLIPTTLGSLRWHAEVVAGDRRLPIDWPFPVDPGGTQASTLRRLDGDVRHGRLTARQVGDGWGGTRTLAMMFMLDERRGVLSAVTPGDVLAYYRTAPECRELDGPDACRS